MKTSSHWCERCDLRHRLLFGSAFQPGKEELVPYRQHDRAYEQANDAHSHESADRAKKR